MPERLDRVTILLNGGPVVISWEDRIELLMRMDTEHDVGERLYAQFMAVGATREVTPDADETRYLRDLLGGPQPPGLERPGNTLDEELPGQAEGLG